MAITWEPFSSSTPACGAWSTTVPGGCRRGTPDDLEREAFRRRLVLSIDECQPDERRHFVACVAALHEPEDEEEDRGREAERRRAPRATTDTGGRRAAAARPRRRRRGARARPGSDLRAARQEEAGAAQSLVTVSSRAEAREKPAIGTAGFEPTTSALPKAALYQAELRPVRLSVRRGYSDSMSARSSPSFSRRRSSRSPRSIRVEQVAHERRELERIERLRHVVDAADVEAARAVAELGARGEEDDRDVLRRADRRASARRHASRRARASSRRGGSRRASRAALPRARSGRRSPRAPPCPRPRG